MQRTYGRRALRKRSGVQPDHHEPDLLLSDHSPPRKRHKVFVEIVSPKRKHLHTENPSPSLLPSARKPSDSDRKPPVTQLEPASGSPDTPKRSPRDPASFFTTPSHYSDGKSTRGSIVKRMLGRSRTESSLEATPSTEMLPVSTSNAQMARHASFHALPTTFAEAERETTPETSTQLSPKSIPTRNIRTYAGSSRSFLVALPVPDAGPIHAIEDDAEPHESYTDLRTRWGIDMSEDDPRPFQDEQTTAPAPLRRNPSDLSQHSLPPGMMNDLKSITELRSKGENRRFLDEVGYLFEGLDGSSAIGLRRASAFEIVNKLCDPDFNRRAKMSDFYIRTWNKFWAARGGTSDKILDVTIAFFAALAARDLRTIVDVAHQKEFIPTLVEILNSTDYRKDVLALVLANGSDDSLRSQGILRTELTALKSLAQLASKESSLFSVSQPSARFFISYSLATLPPSLLAAQYLPILLVNLRAELTLLEPCITAYETGLSLLPPPTINQKDVPSLFHVEACLRLLDSYLLGQWSPASSTDDQSLIGMPHASGFTSELISLCVTSNFLEGSEGEVTIARKCLCGALRVLTLLSHDDPWWCDAALEVSDALPFAVMTAMQSQARWLESRNSEESQNTSVEVFDLLCLALGLVMNWAALSPKAAALSRTKSINPTCPRSHLCVRACRCPDQRSILECFTSLHVQYADDHQSDSPECAFLRGYTAILLGLLIKDDTSNQTIVLSTLPGASPSDRIHSLILHCNAFLELYNDTVPVSSPKSSRATPEEAAPERHRATWDKRGEDIARSVIASLERLYKSIT